MSRRSFFIRHRTCRDGVSRLWLSLCFVFGNCALGNLVFGNFAFGYFVFGNLVFGHYAVVLNVLQGTPPVSPRLLPAQPPLPHCTPLGGRKANFFDKRKLVFSNPPKTFPKSQKSDPRTPKHRFLMELGSILKAIFDQSFKIFQKTPKARFY